MKLKLPNNYNLLTPKERRLVREEYIKKQKGLCYYCGEDLNKKPRKDIRKLSVTKHIFPPNFFKYPVHLHHDHDDGMTIGAVHCHCNAVLFEYEWE